MAYYNKGSKYNDKYGSYYNSAPRLVLVQDNGTAVELVDLSALLALLETGAVTENIGITASFQTFDTGIGADNLQLTANLPIVDSGIGNDLLASLNATMTIPDTGQGAESSAKVAKAFYLIDSYNVLQPLGVIVLTGKDGDLLPPVKEFREQIPGRHGDIILDHDYKARVIELRVANSTSPETREQIKRAMAQWLNPTTGPQPLIFTTDQNKTYYVRYAGKIPLDQWPNYMEFVIPLKMTDPIIVGSFEEEKAGSGILNNEGNVEAPLTIEVAGPITNPSITVGASTLAYTGTINAGSKLVIDTGALTVELDGANAMQNYSGGFPGLPPGDTAVTASAQVTFRWRARWVG